MRKFTVIGFNESSGQIFSEWVDADDSWCAFRLVAVQRPEDALIACLDGHVMEGQGVEFIGQAVAACEDVADGE